MSEKGSNDNETFEQLRDRAVPIPHEQMEASLLQIGFKRLDDNTYELAGQGGRPQVRLVCVSHKSAGDADEGDGRSVLEELGLCPSEPGAQRSYGDLTEEEQFQVCSRLPTLMLWDLAAILLVYRTFVEDGTAKKPTAQDIAGFDRELRRYWQSWIENHMDWVLGEGWDRSAMSKIGGK